MLFLFFFNDTATTEIYTLSLHDALPISVRPDRSAVDRRRRGAGDKRDDGRHLLRRLEALEEGRGRSEEYTSELQSRLHLVCRLLLEKKNRHISLCASTDHQST